MTTHRRLAQSDIPSRKVFTGTLLAQLGAALAWGVLSFTDYTIDTPTAISIVGAAVGVWQYFLPDKAPVIVDESVNVIE